MKTQIITACTALLCVLPAIPVFAQGELEPPGPPQPMMKTLAQLEPRIPISEPGIIEMPGSYYLVNNILVDGGNAITVVTDGVTLDLNGFTIRSSASPATGRGIFLEGDRRNITIINGFIVGGVTNNNHIYEGPGFGAGIYSDDADASINVLVRNVSVSGCQNNGIHLGHESTIVESCTVFTAGNYGIYASIIRDCIAQDCGNRAINGLQVADCQGTSVFGNGVSGLVVQNCYGYSHGSGNGVEALNALNCYGYSHSGNGIASDVAIGCTGWTSFGTGISADIANSCEASSENILYKYNMP